MHTHLSSAGHDTHRWILQITSALQAPSRLLVARCKVLWENPCVSSSVLAFIQFLFCCMTCSSYAGCSLSRCAAWLDCTFILRLAASHPSPPGSTRYCSTWALFGIAFPSAVTSNINMASASSPPPSIDRPPTGEMLYPNYIAFRAALDCHSLPSPLSRLRSCPGGRDAPPSYE